MKRIIYDVGKVAALSILGVAIAESLGIMSRVRGLAAMLRVGTGL